MVDEAFSISGWRNFTALFNSPILNQVSFHIKYDSYIWSYGCGGRNFTSVAKGLEPQPILLIKARKQYLRAFWQHFGDWDSQNNFMRAALASNGWILTCCGQAARFTLFTRWEWVKQSDIACAQHKII